MFLTVRWKVSLQESLVETTTVLIMQRFRKFSYRKIKHAYFDTFFVLFSGGIHMYDTDVKGEAWEGVVRTKHVFEEVTMVFQTGF